jgi:hypothetical protein
MFIFFSPSGAGAYLPKIWIIFSTTCSGVNGSVSIPQNFGQPDSSTISGMSMGFLDRFKKMFDTYLSVLYIPNNEYTEAL